MASASRMISIGAEMPGTVVVPWIVGSDRRTDM
jgi:hypothetical protein